MSNIRTCSVSEQDTVDFWDLFLAANQSNRVSANGLVSGDRMFLCAQLVSIYHFSRFISGKPLNGTLIGTCVYTK